MLLAKSSHDLDCLSFIVGKRVRRVSSFGGLAHFTPANKPAEAADRCLDCPLMNTCAYSAPIIYQRFLGDPVGERWPLSVLSTDTSAEGVHQALLTGPYGECVYNGQNDVADHQVVNLEFADGSTAAFTVTAFTELAFRKTRIFGTRGSIEGDGQSFEVLDFTTGARRTVDTAIAGGASAADGHGGADGELVGAFLDYVDLNAIDAALAQAEQGLEAHRIVWAAERSRRTGEVIEMAATQPAGGK
jgi:predicted dehydrogenase